MRFRAPWGAPVPPANVQNRNLDAPSLRSVAAEVKPGWFWVPACLQAVMGCLPVVHTLLDEVLRSKAGRTGRVEMDLLKNSFCNISWVGRRHSRNGAGRVTTTFHLKELHEVQIQIDVIVRAGPSAGSVQHQLCEQLLLSPPSSPPPSSPRPGRCVASVKGGARGCSEKRRGDFSSRRFLSFRNIAGGAEMARDGAFPPAFFS